VQILTPDGKIMSDQNNFIFTEINRCKISTKNLSSKFNIKNAYLICSHPMIFGFSKLKVFDSLEAQEEKEMDFQIRTCLLNQTDTKFLIRYEVENNSE